MKTYKVNIELTDGIFHSQVIETTSIDEANDAFCKEKQGKETEVVLYEINDGVVSELDRK